MDLRSQTSLVGAIVALAIAGSVLLRSNKRRTHWLFVLFALNVTLWYLTNFLDRIAGGPIWPRANAVAVVLLPLGALQFFRAFRATTPTAGKNMARASWVLGALMLPLALSPWQKNELVSGVIFAYVVGLIGAALWLLWTSAAGNDSRVDRARTRYLAIVGALAALSTVVDFLPRTGLDIPPVGTVLTLVFLFVLSQSLLRYRLLDLYELAGRLAVLTALAFALAGIFWILVYVAGGRFFLHAVLAGLVVLLLFDPLRTKVEEQIAQVFFRERYDLERTAVDLRRRLAHVLEVDEMARLVVGDLERSRRITHAAVYLIDVERRGYDLVSHAGPQPVARLEAAPLRPLLERLGAGGGALTREALEREVRERRDQGSDRDVEPLLKILETLDSMQAAVCLGIQESVGAAAPGSMPNGLLCLADERLRDAYSPEEVALLQGIAVQAAIAVDNSELYQRMKQRDRLAALGEMATGLAHEIRNPLGAIKGAAQFLADPGDGHTVDASAREFLDIIVEEVDRLNGVVGSFLEYARPPRGNPSVIELNSVVERTMRVLSLERDHPELRVRVTLGADLPPVRIDAEQLRQVLMNLVQNATQAMEGRGELAIETRVRTDLASTTTTTREEQARARPGASWVEVRVSDTGPGIAKTALTKLFIPFFTTKEKGTGLGLAISQRIVQGAGGNIHVRTAQGVGTVFVVRLPAADPARASAGDTDPGVLRTSSPSHAAAPAPAPAPSTRAPSTAPKEAAGGE
ncbi:MAG: two-component system sensor protein [Deltaproteobacteria bacterium]|nr:two-component system sensor protein [Deltaproteobacteria bacterium]